MFSSVVVNPIHHALHSWASTNTLRIPHWPLSVGGLPPSLVHLGAFRDRSIGPLPPAVYPLHLSVFFQTALRSFLSFYNYPLIELDNLI